MNLWNDRGFEPPTDNFCIYDRSDIEKLGNLGDLVEKFNNIADVFSGNVLWVEVKLFQAIVKRIALSQLADKFLKHLQQVNHCLRNLALMNMPKILLNLSKCFDRNAKGSSIFQLPSKQQLEFLLIKCQGAAKLLCQTQSYIFGAFSYLIQTLGIGHVLPKLLMACAVVSRIGVMLRNILYETCNFYKELMPWLQKLKESNWKWSQPLQLSMDLWEWLSPEDIELYRNAPSVFAPFLGKLSEENAVGESLIEDEEQSEMPEDMDLGEVVLREDENVVHSVSSKKSNLERRMEAATTFKSLFALCEEICIEKKSKLIFSELSRPLFVKKIIRRYFVKLRKRMLFAKENKDKVMRKSLVLKAQKTFLTHLSGKSTLERRIKTSKSFKSLYTIWNEIDIEKKPELICEINKSMNLKRRTAIQKLFRKLGKGVLLAKERKDKKHIKLLVKNAREDFMTHLGIGTYSTMTVEVEICKSSLDT